MSYNDIVENLRDILKQRYEIESTSNLFNALPSNEKVSFTYGLLLENGLLPVLKKSSSKSTTQAISYRTQGNKVFCRKKETEALNFYSNSVRLSLPNSKELSLAYANRSAVLFKIGKFDLCILDINRALQIDYPENLKYKLHERKGKCLQKIGRYAEAKQSFQNAQMYLCKTDISPEQRSALENSLNQYIKEYERNDENHEKINSVKNFPLPELLSKNSLIPNASCKIRLNSSPEMGRHFIASEDIEPGEILAVEKPFASILLPDYYISHCSNCFVRNLAMIPCERCSLVMFCNEKCRQECMTCYHATECDILPFLFSLDFSKMELLAVRILMIATNQGKNIGQLFRDPVFGTPLPYPIPSDLLNMNDVYISENYDAVHMLEENFFKRPPSDLFQRSATAAVLLHVIKSSNFFKNAKSKSNYNIMKDLKQFAGSLLLKYLCIVLCNAHEISEVVQDSSRSQSKLGNRILEIGAALYPLLSLINHSCDPNVVRHSYHDNVVLRAIQPIAKDQQVFDNYGYHYAVHDLNKRQYTLKLQYYFICGCEACTFNWPLYRELPSEHPTYLSINVPFKKLEEFSQNFKNTLSKIINSEMDGVLEGLCQHLSLLYKSIQRPWKEYSECQEAIKECLAYQGNHYVTSTDFILNLNIENGNCSSD